ncbi:response regulator [bacterium]|nr:response regulator [bacterium]
MAKKKPIKILNVDDNEDVAELIDGVFKGEGEINGRPLEVTTTSDSVKAAEYIKETMFDAAIINKMMPHYDGYDICKMLKEKNPEAVAILQSADCNEQSFKGAFEFGFNEYIVAPFEPEVLLRRISRYF